jgi:hypothetical protein
MEFKTIRIRKAKILIAQIDAAGTAEELEAITW